VKTDFFERQAEILARIVWSLLADQLTQSGVAAAQRIDVLAQPRPDARTRPRPGRY
jgi:hypothetical protein